MHGIYSFIYVKNPTRCFLIFLVSVNKHNRFFDPGNHATFWFFSLVIEI